MQVSIEVSGKDRSDGELGSGMKGEVKNGANVESVTKHALDMSVEELKGWQANDESLKDVRKVEKCEAKECVGFFVQGG